MAVSTTQGAAPRPVRRTQQQRSAIAREKLIESAIGLICSKGFSITTMADIAAEAGMTRGAIQHHFAGRNELVLAILHEVEGRIRDSFSDALIDRNLALAERIDRLIDHLGEVGSSPAYLAVMDIWISTRAEPGLRDAVRESVLRASESYRDLWQRAFGSDAPAETVSECRRVVVAVMRGSVVSRIFVKEPRSFIMTLETMKKMIASHMSAAG
jgi:AcrR family transcriptional regulator